MDGSRALQGAPGVLGGVFLEALEVSRGAFWMIFLGLGGTGRENGEMLESDDPLNENGMIRGSQRPQHETKMDPEEQRRENRSTLAGWLVGWWLGWCLGWCLVVAWGRPGGGGEFVRVSLTHHLGALGETIEGEQRPEKPSHSLVAPHKGGLPDYTK